MDPFNAILDKTEEAFHDLIDALKDENLKYTNREKESVDIPIHDAFSDELDIEEDKQTFIELPYISIIAEDAVIRIPHTANFDVSVRIEVRSSGIETTRSEHKRRTGVVADILWHTATDGGEIDVVAQINALGLTEFTAKVWNFGRMARDIDIEEDAMVSRMEGVLMCFGG